MFQKILVANRGEIAIRAFRAAVDAAISGMERGADDFLMKPIDLTILADKIRDAHQRCCSLSSQRLQR